MYDSYNTGLNLTKGGEAPRRGIPTTEETKQKQSKSNTGKVRTDEHRKAYSRGKDSMKKPINQIDKHTGITLTTWESQSKASRDLGISQMSIQNCLSGRSKTAGGFIWKYR